LPFWLRSVHTASGSFLGWVDWPGIKPCTVVKHASLYTCCANHSNSRCKYPLGFPHHLLHLTQLARRSGPNRSPNIFLAAE